MAYYAERFVHVALFSDLPPLIQEGFTMLFLMIHRTSVI
jgi:hypothetical protein